MAETLEQYWLREAQVELARLEAQTRLWRATVKQFRQALDRCEIYRAALDQYAQAESWLGNALARAAIERGEQQCDAAS